MGGISTEEIYQRSFGINRGVGGGDDPKQLNLKNEGELKAVCDSIFKEFPPLRSVFVGWSRTEVGLTELIECAYDVRDQDLPRLKYIFSLAMIENKNLTQEEKEQIIDIIFNK